MRRTRRSRTITLATAALLLAAAIAFTTGAEPAAAAGPVRVMDFNICGSICNHGVIDKPGATDIVDEVRNRVRHFKPHILTLNEVCIAQFQRLKALFAGGSWKMRGVFRPQRNDSRCRKGTSYGDAVFSSAGVHGQKVLQLPDPPKGPENRAILCIRTSAGGGPVLACTLHLVTRDPMKAKQIAAAARALNDEAEDGAVILGGDFNKTPSGMGALLDPDRGGRFFDVDPQKAPTRGQKIDYILFSRAHFANPSGGPHSSPLSDHDVLIGQATRR